MRAEMAVSWAHRIWSGQRTEGRGLGTSPLSEREVAIAMKALDDARARWDALDEGASLVWPWRPERQRHHSPTSL